MCEEESTFGAEPQYIDKLILLGLENSEEESSGPKIEHLGGRISRYKLLHVLGEGGMGIVYLAEQTQPVRRQVALKIIKPGMDSRRVLARFEAEQQALALMEHPHVARVYDAGLAPSGRPYFVMEHVKGIPITEHCDKYKLTIEQRLHLFLHVCEAVQYAHQKGIIHRDLKPSNILIVVEDKDMIPKVIDFGVARAISQSLTERTLYTEQGQLVGTPEYMSPEQAEMTGQDIDTRSDIYSLGVVLYELLTGVLPFESATLRQGSPDHLRQVLCEQDPKTPSMCLSRLTREDSTRITQNRQVVAGVLRRQLEGDLDWIVMKCLEKDRTRRYETASDLAMDLKRYLANEPVAARPPTVGYRLRKAWRRNKLLYSGTAAVVVALIIGSVVATTGWWQAILARANEKALRQQAERQELVARRRAYAADMNLAQQALAVNNLGRALMLLDRQKPEPDQEDLRGWEWRYLWSQTRHDEHEVFFTETDRLDDLEYSSDGRFLMWNTQLGMEVVVTDVQTHQRVLSRTNCSRAAFARRSPWLAFTQRKDKEDDIVLWDLATSDEIHRFTTKVRVAWLEFTPDDRLLLSASWNQMQSQWELAVWELSAERVLWQKIIERPCPNYWRMAAISPDGQFIAMGFYDFFVRVFRISDGSEKFSDRFYDTFVTALSFSPDGTFLLLASGLESSTIQLWDVDRGQCIGTLEERHRSFVTDLRFTPDGEHLISSSADQTIWLWDWTERKPMANLRGHFDMVDGLAVSPEGNVLASRCRDGSVFLWPLLDRSGRIPPYRVLPVKLTTEFRHDSYNAPAVFTPDSRSIIAIETDGGLAQWDVVTLQEIRRWRAPEQKAGRVAAIAPDGTQAAIHHADGSLSFLDLATGVERTNVLKRAARIDYCWFSASSRHLVTVTFEESGGGYDGQFWDLARGEIIGIFQGQFPRRWLARTILTQDVWAIGVDKVRIWNLNRPQGPPLELLPDTHSSVIEDFDISPDGRLGAAPYQNGYIRVWNMETTEPVRMIRVFSRSVDSVIFSPDGHRLAGASHDREAVKLLETTVWQEVLTLAGEGTGFRFVAFSPDGQTLIARNWDGLLHIWSAPSLEDIEKADATSISKSVTPFPTKWSHGINESNSTKPRTNRN